jgi:hypothetical protein
MLGSVKTVIGIIVFVAVSMRRATAFAPRIAGRLSSLSWHVHQSSSLSVRWMSNDQVTQEKSEEEQAAIKAAREARK